MDPLETIEDIEKKREAFQRHCEAAARTIDTWPEWKKEIFGLYVKTEKKSSLSICKIEEI